MNSMSGPCGVAGTFWIFKEVLGEFWANFIILQKEKDGAHVNVGALAAAGKLNGRPLLIGIYKHLSGVYVAHAVVCERCAFGLIRLNPFFETILDQARRNRLRLEALPRLINNSFSCSQKKLF